jgi:hypothetical protein
MSTPGDTGSVTQTLPSAAEPEDLDAAAGADSADVAAQPAPDVVEFSGEGSPGADGVSVAVPGAPATPEAPRQAPRRVRLAVSRIDPWSIMKMSFLFSVAIGIAGVVMTAVLWTILNGLGIFSDIDRIISENQLASAQPIYILDYVGFRRVVSLSVVIGVLDVVLMTAIATLSSFLYNISSSLVGGVQLTLTDD